MSRTSPRRILTPEERERLIALGDDWAREQFMLTDDLIRQAEERYRQLFREEPESEDGAASLRQNSITP